MPNQFRGGRTLGLQGPLPHPPGQLHSPSNSDGCKCQIHPSCLTQGAGIAAVKAVGPCKRIVAAIGSMTVLSQTVMMTPSTQYARIGDLHIAYQTVGEGAVDIVLSEQWVSHMEAQWDVPPLVELRKRLATFGRVILFDKRGVGMSDPVSLRSLPSLETWMDDLRAVMDSAGSSEAVLIATMAGALMGLVFAASHPDRVRGLVIADGFARAKAADDYPIGLSSEEIERLVAQIELRWGRGLMLDSFAPSMRSAPGLRDAWARYERFAASPGTAEAMIGNIYQLDVRHVLPAIRVPTLIIHHADAKGFHAELGRHLAANITGARYVELPGIDNAMWAGDQAAIVAEIEEFVTGSRRQQPADRRLSTILITDIVESTRRASEIGDRAWRELLARHEALARGMIQDAGGQFIKSMGDGVLATFDGPGRAIGAARGLSRGGDSLGVKVRAGLHTGEIELVPNDIAGVAVHISSRVAALAHADEILVTSTVRDMLLGSDVRFAERGWKTLKGVPGRWRLYSVAGVG
jgi:class 3 adenylate cyclase